jgi:hypothetical protein
LGVFGRVLGDEGLENGVVFVNIMFGSFFTIY